MCLYLYVNKLQPLDTFIPFSTSTANIHQLKLFSSGGNYSGAMYNTYKINIKNFTVLTKYSLANLVINYSLKS